MGELLKRWRLSVPLSQREVAARLGVQQPQYCQWERGTQLPTVFFLKRLCAISFGELSIHSILEVWPENGRPPRERPASKARRAAAA